MNTDPNRLAQIEYDYRSALEAAHRAWDSGKRIHLKSAAVSWARAASLADALYHLTDAATWFERAAAANVAVQRCLYPTKLQLPRGGCPECVGTDGWHANACSVAVQARRRERTA